MSNQLTARQEKFVAAYLKLGNATKAAIEAGFAPQSARSRGYALLNHNEHVKAALDEARKEIRRQGIDDAQATLEELDEAIAFARATKNATALARCIELKAKIKGLMDGGRGTKPPGEPFRINIIGINSPSPAPPKDVTPPAPAGTIGLVDLLEGGASVERSKGTTIKGKEFSIFD